MVKPRWFTPFRASWKRQCTASSGWRSMEMHSVWNCNVVAERGGPHCTIRRGTRAQRTCFSVYMSPASSWRPRRPLATRVGGRASATHGSRYPGASYSSCLCIISTIQNRLGVCASSVTSSGRETAKTCEGGPTTRPTSTSRRGETTMRLACSRNQRIT